MTSLNKFSYEQATQLFKSGQVKSLLFTDMLSCIKARMEIDGFGVSKRALAEEMCLIIWEIFMLPPKTLVRIAKSDLESEMVSQVYLLLTHEHLLHVIDSFSKIGYEIKNKKTYLRTALYNSVFECEAQIINEAGQVVK
jgi:hypothetical protein